MAKDTSPTLRNSLIYSVYLRSYKEGTFRALQEDLPRIKALGADIIWLLPIHPIGKAYRKGSLGSPYSISDYRGVNEEYGSLEDFKALLRAMHSEGLRCMLDVVYNHTAWDSVIATEHPEWFHRGEEGGFGNRAGAWSDVIDLDYTKSRELWDYQLDTLCWWAELGVDGFRCDVASLVPVEFWAEARRRVAEVRPGVVWLAESVHPSFLQYVRGLGFGAWSDGELYEAFDITYDYDIHDRYDAAVRGEGSVGEYLAAVMRQEWMYPANYVKLRFLENHDHPRAAELIRDRDRLRMWTAYTYLCKGTALLYAGQEALDMHWPSLFERDPVDWSGEEAAFTDLLHRLGRLRADPILRDGRYSMGHAGDTGEVAVVQYEDPATGRVVAGVFDLVLGGGVIEPRLPEGRWKDLLTGEAVEVADGRLRLNGRPLVLEKQ